MLAVRPSREATLAPAWAAIRWTSERRCGPHVGRAGPLAVLLRTANPDRSTIRAKDHASHAQSVSEYRHKFQHVKFVF